MARLWASFALREAAGRHGVGDAPGARHLQDAAVALGALASTLEVHAEGMRQASWALGWEVAARLATATGENAFAQAGRYEREGRAGSVEGARQVAAAMACYARACGAAAGREDTQPDRKTKA
jgi:hypothetical protein